MTIKQVQHLLAYLGYDVTPDGIYGDQTCSATARFQTDFGNLDADGIPGQETQIALQMAVGHGWQKPAEVQEGTFWEEIIWFTPGEFVCPCGCGTGDPEEALVRKVDEIRRRLGVPVTITSGVRCAAHNAKVGGVSNSQHLYHRAADLHSGVSPQKMREVAEAVLGDTGGLGVYSWGIHVDTRPAKARWKG